jgi:branched-chain amino acid transport system permease protein
MLRALIFCCVAGLGNINGAVYVAFALGLFEMTIQYTVAAQFGLPTVLGLVILLLIWRPEGLFGHARVSHS